jgi:hypothetical protein
MTTTLTCDHSVPVAGFQLVPHVPRDQIHSKQIRDMADLGVLLELRKVRERYTGTQFLDPLWGDVAVVYQCRIALEDRFGEKLATRNRDAKLLFESKDDVEEVG